MKRMIYVFSMLAILIELLGTAMAQDTVLQLKEKIIDLQNQGELGFRNFTLCNNILGYGQYVEAPTNQVKAGTEIYFYYEPVNLFTNRRVGTYHIWYTQDMIVLAADGTMIYNGEEMLNFNYQTTSPVLDVYATNSLDLGDLPAGRYQFKVVVHDKLRNKDAAISMDFEIVQ